MQYRRNLVNSLNCQLLGFCDEPIQFSVFFVHCDGNAYFQRICRAQLPDLEGIWTNKSLTGLQRPKGVEHLIASPEEALAIAARTPIAGLEGGLDEGDGVNNTPEAGAGDFGVRAYNSFWVEPGNNLALVKGEYRTSYIIDPPDGRVPRLADPQYDFDRDNFGSRYATGIADFSGLKHSRIQSAAFLDLAIKRVRG